MTNRAGRPGRPKPAGGWGGWASPGWLLVLGVWLGSLLSVALNTATNTSARYPGPLRLLQQYPWQIATLLTLVLGVLAWRQYQHAATSQPQGGGPLTGAITGWRAAPPTAAELARLRRELLERVHRTWIEGVLDRSLAKVTEVELGLTEQPAVVTQFWGTLHQPGQPDQMLPPGTRISTVAGRFDRQLLILGAPGAGKTTLLLQYARDLLQQAERDAAAPIPVVFHLSAWTGEQSVLAEWLVEELVWRYGVSRRLADELVDRDRLAVLLDGLDEVPAKQQAACVEAINAFRGEHGGVPLVVCARSRNYQELAARLDLKGAVAVQPLDREQVRGWLAAAGPPLAGLRAALRDRDHWLWKLLDSPLLLSIAELAYMGQPASAIRAHGSEEALLDAYVKAMLARPRAPLATPQDQPAYADADTLRWLGWLAERMGDQSVFYPDWMQPDWLPTRRQRWLTTTGLGLAVGLAGGLTLGLAAGLAVGGGLYGGLAVGLAAGLGISWYMGLTRHGARIEPIEPIRWSWSAARDQLSSRLTVRLAVFGLFFGAYGGQAGWMAGGLIGGLIGGLVLVVVGGAGLMLASGFEYKSNLRPAAPLEGIRAAGRNGPSSGLLAGLAGLAAGLAVYGLADLAGWLAGGLTEVLTEGLAVGLTGGLSGGLIVGLPRGGATYLRHRLLVLRLQRQGLIPADLIGFLDYADSRILLRRAGGGYTFIHRLLQDYLRDRAHQGRPSPAAGNQQRARVR